MNSAVGFGSDTLMKHLVAFIVVKQNLMYRLSYNNKVFSFFHFIGKSRLFAGGSGK